MKKILLVFILFTFVLLGCSRTRTLEGYRGIPWSASPETALEILGEIDTFRLNLDHIVEYIHEGNEYKERVLSFERGVFTPSTPYIAENITLTFCEDDGFFSANVYDRILLLGSREEREDRIKEMIRRYTNMYGRPSRSLSSSTTTGWLFANGASISISSLGGVSYNAPLD
jgi:hypothetical protein